MRNPFRAGAQPLGIWQRTNSPGVIDLISWHSRHSLTWSWFVSFSRFRADEARVRPLWGGFRHNCGGQWFLRVPYCGLLTLHRQQPMWYRDMMDNQRDRHREDEREAFERGRRVGRRDVFQGVGRD